MLYRLRVDLAFPEITNPNTLKDLIEDYFEPAVTINPGQPSQEQGFITLEQCYHDEAPGAPCVLLFEKHTP